MRVRTKIASLIIAFCIFVSFIVVGVFAATEYTVPLKGNMDFTATSVFATVEADIENENVEKTLPTLNYKTGKTDQEQTDFDNGITTWGNHTLNFKEDGSDIVVTVTITNKATDRKLYACVNTNGTFENITTTMTSTQNETTSEYVGYFIVVPEKVADSTQNVVTVTITLTSTSTLTDLNYGLLLTLQTERPELLSVEE